MTMGAITGARIWTGSEWRDDSAIMVADGRVAAIVDGKALPQAVQRHDVDGGMIVPGFIDIQVNGGGGVLFNDAPTVEGLATIAAAHRRFGTTAMLPTLISDDLSVIALAIAAVDAAIATGVPGIAGIHIEGPFLNPGKRGIHDACKFRTLDDAAIALLSSLKRGKTLVTLAPELAPQGAISALVDAGVIVSAGHTLASYADMQSSMASGLTGVTHLFNAMTQMEGRSPGVVGAALASDLCCGIIVDGFHVDPATLRVAHRTKGWGELMLVTDAMPTVGSSVREFTIGQTDITAEDGVLRSADGTLAGSDLDMASAVRNCIDLMQVDLPDALRMASLTPALFLGLGGMQGRVAEGYRADFVHLDDRLNVRSTWIAGEVS